jgi:tetratricopeptide (TPR) repeat protein
VCGAPPLAPLKVFGLLAALVDKSLVVAQRDAPETRYRQLETIREYSEERLAEIGETELLRTTHAEYFCQLAHGLQGDLFGPRQITAGRRLVAEQENVLAAVNHAIDTDNVDLALRLVRNSLRRGIQAGWRLILPVDAVLRLAGAADHPLYAFGLAVAANDAAFRGDLSRAEVACEEALASARRLSWDPEVDVLVSAARGIRAIAIGAWDEAAAEMEHTVELARAARNDDQVGDHLAGAAFAYTMAGNPDAAARLASEALDLGRRSGAPAFIAQSLTALAGAIADREPQRARALLAESLELRAAIGSQRAYDSTHTVLIATRIADWPLVLKLAPDAIRHHNWAGERPYLSGIFNVVARALASGQPESAAVLQGAARRLTPGVARAPRGIGVAAANAISPAAGAAETASWVTELRRQTTAALQDALGEKRLHQLRAEGEAMDDAHAVAYALEAISRAPRG